MTDAPIYLVSACGSGEEFVAAFRRYADKHGLFVPIAEPLAAGQRTRFAVTLRDGGVMIEGEAEVVSSARTASVLHGRVGMTLKFVEPDAPSKTMLAELEKARLSMRPAPPSVAPRPASVPAEPRPVPPPVQGRIDATNALAECVAIAAPERLEALALAAAAPGKPGGKFVVPPIAPGRAKPATTPPVVAAPPSTTKPTVAARPLARAGSAQLPSVTSPTGQVPAVKPATEPAGKPVTGPIPTVKPSAKSATGPIPSLRSPTGQVPSLSSTGQVPSLAAKPAAATRPSNATEPQPALSLESTQPDEPRTGFSQTMAAVAPIIDRGPTSETMIVALPPEPDPALGLTTDPGTDLDLAVTVSRTGTKPGTPPPPSSLVTMSGVPFAVPPSSSAPTDIGGALLDPALLGDDRASLDALAPEPTTSPEATAAPEPTSTELTATELTAPDAEPTTPPDAALVEPPTSPEAAIDPTGAIVEATPADEDASARTQVHAGVPPREPSGRAQAFPTMRGASIDLLQTMRTPPPEMDEIRALLAADRRPMSSERKPEVEIAEPTDLSMAPPPPAPMNETPSQRARRTAIGVAVIPAGLADASELPSSVSGSISMPQVSGAPEPAAPSDAVVVERSQPVPLSGVVPSLPVPALLGASSIIVDAAVAVGEEPTGADRVVIADDGIDVTAPTRQPAAAPVEEPTPSEYWTISPDGSLASKPKDPNRPRSNSSAPIAMAASPSGGTADRPRRASTAPPARPRTPSGAPSSGPVASSTAAPSGPTAALSAPTAAPSAPTAALSALTPAPSGPTAAPSGPTVAPSGPVASLAAPVASAPPAPDVAPASEPAGRAGRFNTVIGPPAPANAKPAAAKPASNGHAMPPVEVASPAALAGGAAPPTPALPSGDWLIALDPGAPDGWSEPFETVPQPLLDDDAPAEPPAPPHRPSMRADEMPVAEPKVQIDPTLIEPLATLPSEEPYSRPSVPAIPMYGAPAGFAPMPSPMPMPMPMPIGLPPTPPPPGFHGAPAYPMDPAYQMVPVATLPRATTADGSGLDPRYASDHALPAQRRRRVIIVLATAIVAVALGIFALAALTNRHEASPPVEHPVEPPPTHSQSAPPAVPPAHVAAPHEETHADVAPGAVAPHVTAVPEAAPAAASECFADVVTVPAGAEIVLGDTNVVGTTPQRVTLPCGDKLELTLRKAHLVSATRTITPTPEGAKVRVALAKQLVQIKVSSTPAGATITLAGKPLGVTPTTIKVPAFEASTLNITKDGYAAETEKVAPRSNGTAVHTNLRKLERRPR